jgi:hypothetical protein
VVPPAEPVPTGSDTESETAVAALAAGSLSLQLEVDFSAREARLRLNHADEPLRLVCEDGLWRVAPAEAATEARDSA